MSHGGETGSMKPTADQHSLALAGAGFDGLHPKDIPLPSDAGTQNKDNGPQSLSTQGNTKQQRSSGPSGPSPTMDSDRYIGEMRPSNLYNGLSASFFRSHRSGRHRKSHDARNQTERGDHFTAHGDQTHALDSKFPLSSDAEAATIPAVQTTGKTPLVPEGDVNQSTSNPVEQPTIPAAAVSPSSPKKKKAAESEAAATSSATTTPPSGGLGQQVHSAHTATHYNAATSNQTKDSSGIGAKHQEKEDVGREQSSEPVEHYENPTNKTSNNTGIQKGINGTPAAPVDVAGDDTVGIGAAAQAPRGAIEHETASEPGQQQADATAAYHNLSAVQNQDHAPQDTQLPSPGASNAGPSFLSSLSSTSHRAPTGPTHDPLVQDSAIVPSSRDAPEHSTGLSRMYSAPSASNHHTSTTGYHGHTATEAIHEPFRGFPPQHTEPRSGANQGHHGLMQTATIHQPYYGSGSTSSASVSSSPGALTRSATAPTKRKTWCGFEIRAKEKAPNSPTPLGFGFGYKEHKKAVRAAQTPIASPALSAAGVPASPVIASVQAQHTGSSSAHPFHSFSPSQDRPIHVQETYHAPNKPSGHYLSHSRSSRGPSMHQAASPTIARAQTQPRRSSGAHSPRSFSPSQDRPVHVQETYHETSKPRGHYLTYSRTNKRPSLPKILPDYLPSNMRRPHLPPPPPAPPAARTQASTPSQATTAAPMAAQGKPSYGAARPISTEVPDESPVAAAAAAVSHQRHDDYKSSIASPESTPASTDTSPVAAAAAAVSHQRHDGYKDRGEAIASSSAVNSRHVSQEHHSTAAMLKRPKAVLSLYPEEEDSYPRGERSQRDNPTRPYHVIGAVEEVQLNEKDMHVHHDAHPSMTTRVAGALSSMLPTMGSKHEDRNKDVETITESSAGPTTDHTGSWPHYSRDTAIPTAAAIPTGIDVAIAPGHDTEGGRNVYQSEQHATEATLWRPKTDLSLYSEENASYPRGEEDEHDNPAHPDHSVGVVKEIQLNEKDMHAHHDAHPSMTTRVIGALSSMLPTVGSKHEDRDKDAETAIEPSADTTIAYIGSWPEPSKDVTIPTGTTPSAAAQHGKEGDLNVYHPEPHSLDTTSERSKAGHPLYPEEKASYPRGDEDEYDNPAHPDHTVGVVEEIQLDEKDMHTHHDAHPSMTTRVIGALSSMLPTVGSKHDGKSADAGAVLASLGNDSMSRPSMDTAVAGAAEVPTAYKPEYHSTASTFEGDEYKDPSQLDRPIGATEEIQLDDKGRDAHHDAHPRMTTRVIGALSSMLPTMGNKHEDQDMDAEPTVDSSVDLTTAYAESSSRSSRDASVPTSAAATITPYHGGNSGIRADRPEQRTTEAMFERPKADLSLYPEEKASYLRGEEDEYDDPAYLDHPAGIVEEVQLGEKDMYAYQDAYPIMTTRAVEVPGSMMPMMGSKNESKGMDVAAGGALSAAQIAAVLRTSDDDEASVGDTIDTNFKNENDLHAISAKKAEPASTVPTDASILVTDKATSTYSTDDGSMYSSMATPPSTPDLKGVDRLDKETSTQSGHDLDASTAADFSAGADAVAVGAAATAAKGKGVVNHDSKKKKRMIVEENEGEDEDEDEIMETPEVAPLTLDETDTAVAPADHVDGVEPIPEVNTEHAANDDYDDEDIKGKGKKEKKPSKLKARVSRATAGTAAAVTNAATGVVSAAAAYKERQPTMTNKPTLRVSDKDVPYPRVPVVRQRLTMTEDDVEKPTIPVVSHVLALTEDDVYKPTVPQVHYILTLTEDDVEMPMPNLSIRPVLRSTEDDIIKPDPSSARHPVIPAHKPKSVSFAAAKVSRAPRPMIPKHPVQGKDLKMPPMPRMPPMPKMPPLPKMPKVKKTKMPKFRMPRLSGSKLPSIRMPMLSRKKSKVAPESPSVVAEEVRPVVGATPEVAIEGVRTHVVEPDDSRAEETRLLPVSEPALTKTPEPEAEQQVETLSVPEPEPEPEPKEPAETRFVLMEKPTATVPIERSVVETPRLNMVDARRIVAVETPELGMIETPMSAVIETNTPTAAEMPEPVLMEPVMTHVVDTPVAVVDEQPESPVLKSPLPVRAAQPHVVGIEEIEEPVNQPLAEPVEAQEPAMPAAIASAASSPRETRFGRIPTPPSPPPVLRETPVARISTPSPPVPKATPVPEPVVMEPEERTPSVASAPIASPVASPMPMANMEARPEGYDGPLPKAKDGETIVWVNKDRTTQEFYDPEDREEEDLDEYGYRRGRDVSRSVVSNDSGKSNQSTQDRPLDPRQADYHLKDHTAQEGYESSSPARMQNMQEYQDAAWGDGSGQPQQQYGRQEQHEQYLLPQQSEDYRQQQQSNGLLGSGGYNPLPLDYQGDQGYQDPEQYHEEHQQSSGLLGNRGYTTLPRHSQQKEEYQDPEQHHEEQQQSSGLLGSGGYNPLPLDYQGDQGYQDPEQYHEEQQQGSGLLGSGGYNPLPLDYQGDQEYQGPEQYHEEHQQQKHDWLLEDGGYNIPPRHYPQKEEYQESGLNLQQYQPLKQQNSVRSIGNGGYNPQPRKAPF
ncbi:hypothetical protein BGZ54_008168 [Gamsiella multidivaricata]|nr:hypothetical protein BGZ54_008168 [Gamsiella multidivaricata]